MLARFYLGTIQYLLKPYAIHYRYLAFANESCTGGAHGAAITAPPVLWVGGAEGSRPGWSSASGSTSGKDAPGKRIMGFNFDAAETQYGRGGGLWGTARDGTRVEVG